MVRQDAGADNGGRYMFREDGTMDGGGPAAPARRLGRVLRQLRDAAGKTQSEVAQYVGTAATTISKFENGERIPPPPHLKLMCLLFGVDESRAESLMRLAEQAKEPGWWSDYGEDVPKWFTAYVTEENGASAIWTYQQGFIPGLLQTRRYTEVITAAASKGAAETSESADVFARVRATRQQRLHAEPPLVLRAVIDESVLHRGVGEPGVMAEQLAHLREAMRQSNISLRVLPFSVGIHPGCTGSFTVLRFAESSMNMVYVEQRGGAFYLERPRDVDIHEKVFEQLWSLALNSDGTSALLDAIGKG